MIEAYAKRLRLPYIRNNYRELIADARENHPDYEKFLEEILKGETMSRTKTVSRNAFSWHISPIE